MSTMRRCRSAMMPPTRVSSTRATMPAPAMMPACAGSFVMTSARSGTANPKSAEASPLLVSLTSQVR